MVYKNKKHYGFTILELLSTIVVIGIIALIVIPSVLNLMDNSKKESLKVTAKSLVDGAKGYVMTSGDGTAKTFTIENSSFTGDKLPVSGTLPSSGTIMVNENLEIAIAVIEGKLCAKKSYYDESITISDDIGNCTISFEAPAYCFDFNEPFYGTYNKTGGKKESSILLTYNFSKEDGALTFTDEDNESELTIWGYNSSCPKDVVIPSVVDGKTIVAIGRNAFYNKEITNVVIPDTVNYIGNYAFENNLITNLTIPSSVKEIGNLAFENNNITNLTLSYGIEKIGGGAFSNNKLTNVIIPSSTMYINSNAFEQEETYPWSGVTIEYNEFVPRSRFDSSLSNIGWEGVSISYVDDGKTVSPPPESCFIFDSPTGTITGYNYEDADGNDCPIVVNIPTSINGTTVVSIGEGAFTLAGSNIISAKIPNTVTNIDGYAFYNSSLLNISIPNTITTIKDSTFSGTSLTGVTIPSSVTTIGPAAFSNSKLTSINIPNSVTSIDVAAFSYNQLTSVTIPNNLETIPAYCFSSNLLNSVVIPNSVATIGKDAFSNNQLQSVNISSNATYIDQYAFAHNQLTSIVIPPSVVDIMEYAFAYNQLTSLTLNNGLENISWYSFMNNALTNLTIPNTVTVINGLAFYNNRFTNITIPSSVSGMGVQAFEQTSSYPWGTVTIKYNGTNLANRFDSQLSSIGWGSATMSYVSD